MLLLTPAERARFVQYLRQDAESNRMIVNQMENNSSLAPQVLAPIIKKKKQEVAACIVVINMLESGEDTTIAK